MLPHRDYRWIEAANGSFLHFRYKCVALVRGSGELVIYAKKTHTGNVASIAQGKRFIERWIAKNPSFHFHTTRRNP
jgi:hypothetical protein